MSVSLKCSDLINQYDGGCDFIEWVKKLELVAKLQKIGDLEDFLPLFLSGGAFAVYEGLDDQEKQDYTKLKAALTKAFSINHLGAKEEFISRKLREGESVDVYLADLRRLGSLVSVDGSEDWVKWAFISGLSRGVKQVLTAACGLENMTLSEVVDRARIVMQTNKVTVNVAIESGSVHKKLICFTCQREGLGRHCPNRKKDIVCWNCKQSGHFSSQCHEKVRKNE
jgi:hypothetical protein